MKLSKLLQGQRFKTSLTQKQVAQRLGYTHPQFISNWERGKSAPPLKSWQCLQELYDMSNDDVVHAMSSYYRSQHRLKMAQLRSLLGKDAGASKSVQSP